LPSKDTEHAARIEENSEDFADLRRAVKLLETPSLTARITDLIGAPVEWAVKKLPSGAQQKIHKAVEAALYKAVTTALRTMDETDTHQEASLKSHTLAALAAGATGGFFGLPGMVVELPITTTVIMRSIADVARSEGFNISELQTQMQCIAVFGLNGKQAESADAGYFASRAGLHRFADLVGAELGRAAVQATQKAGAKVTEKEAAKWLAELIAKVAARFEIVITEKMAAQAAPIIGAIFGGVLNTLFITFYQNMAKGHFIVSRLTVKYSEEAVEKAYKNLVKDTSR
jgi:hypothetical protein